METNSPAEELPDLYREILDRVARMEASGSRAEAARLRADATRAYSRAWDEKARRRLQQLLHRGERPSIPARSPVGTERRLGQGATTTAAGADSGN